MEKKPSPQWVLWTLDFLLDEQEAGRIAHGTVHNDVVVKSVFNYLRTPCMPFKSNLISILIRILTFPHLFSHTKPPVLRPILAILKDQLRDARAAMPGSQFYSPLFQVCLLLRLLIRFC